MPMKTYLAAMNVLSIVVIAVYALSLVYICALHFDVYAKLLPALASVVLIPLQILGSLLPATIGFGFARPGERREHIKALIFSGVIAGEFALIWLLPSYGSGC